jgi:DNA-binding response OmpR family regulator
VRGLLRLVLENAGHTVLEAADGKTAMHCLKAEPIDLLVTDIVMPEKDGLEVIMEIRRTLPSLKVLALSGGGRISPFSYLALARKLGADAVLAKPFEMHVVLNTVARLLAESTGSA